MENETKAPLNREDYIKELQGALEVQSLQTDLAELRARMFMAHAQEVQAIRMLDSMKAREQESEDQKEAREEFEEVQKERKLKEVK